MPRCKVDHFRVSAISTVVPSQVKRIDDEAAQYGGDQAQLERIKKTIGLSERRVTEEGTTALDLCEAAARRLFAGVDEALETTDGLIFVTQTPDHFQPCNAAVLHGHLGLSTNCAAFDVNLGCSGYVYALWLAGLLTGSGGCRQVLVLAGDTLSRCVNPRDRAVAPLFGDAGTATLVMRDESAPPAWFDLHTDGKGCGHITIPAGAFRQPSTAETGREEADEAGNVRSANDLFMNGAEIFNFSIKVEPPAVKDVLEYSGKQIDAIDAFVFHQANRYIITNICRRLKIPLEKAPSGTVEKYGNQSSASIPATICDALAKPLKDGNQQLLLSGFGVGLSWASVVLEAGRLHYCELTEL